MMRRDFIEDMAIATTAPLAFSRAETATTELQGDIELAGDIINKGKQVVYRRGREEEFLVYVDRIDKVDNPHVTVRSAERGVVRYHVPIDDNAPEPHIGRNQLVMYYDKVGKKETVIFPYLGVPHGVKGDWVQV